MTHIHGPIQNSLQAPGNFSLYPTSSIHEHLLDTPRKEALIMIPSRMGSTRLPHKPMAMIAGEPMIVHVWRKACQAHIAPVVVACDHGDIAEAITRVGGQVVLTKGLHATGSDRLVEALELFDPQGHYGRIINLQGDLPIFPPSLLASILEPLEIPQVGVSTFIQRADPAVPGAVRVRVRREYYSPESSEEPESSEGAAPSPAETQGSKKLGARAPQGEAIEIWEEQGSKKPKSWETQEEATKAAETQGSKKLGQGWWRCTDFTREAWDSPYAHVGIYAFHRRILEQFSRWPQGKREKEESLEQLRFWDHGIPIAGVCLHQETLLSVDTPEDLRRVQGYCALASPR